MGKTITYDVTVYGSHDSRFNEGVIVWTLDGRFHREDGPTIEYPCGAKVWFKDGKGHREDGPAVEYADGTVHWFKHGLIHREDGPAVEYANGDKVWYINGEELTEEEFNKLTKITELTLSDIAKIVGVSVDKLRIKE